MEGLAVYKSWSKLKRKPHFLIYSRFLTNLHNLGYEFTPGKLEIYRKLHRDSLTLFNLFQDECIDIPRFWAFFTFINKSWADISHDLFVRHFYLKANTALTNENISIFSKTGFYRMGFLYTYFVDIMRLPVKKDFLYYGSAIKPEIFSFSEERYTIAERLERLYRIPSVLHYYDETLIAANKGHRYFLKKKGSIVNVGDPFELTYCFSYKARKMADAIIQNKTNLTAMNDFVHYLPVTVPPLAHSDRFGLLFLQGREKRIREDNATGGLFIRDYISRLPYFPPKPKKYNVPLPEDDAALD